MKILYKWIIGIIVLVAISLCLFDSLTPPGTVKPIKIGVITPLSGAVAVAGENFLKGVLLAKEIYESSHPNEKIELIAEDDRYDGKSGLTAYKKLTEINKIDALINATTPTIDAIYNEATKTDIPVIQLGIQTDGLAPDNIFQMSPPPELGMYRIAEFMNKKYSFPKIAVIYDNSPAGILFLKAFGSKYIGKYDEFNIGIGDKNILKDYSTKIVKNKYPAVMFITSADNSAILIKYITTLTDKTPQYIFDSSLHFLTEYKRILGDTKILNGSITVWLKEGNSKKFKEMFKSKYMEDPGVLADFGFDCFNTLMGAYNKNSAIWRKNIQNTIDVGASGGIAFDKNGVRDQTTEIDTVKNGELVMMLE